MIRPRTIDELCRATNNAQKKIKKEEEEEILASFEITSTNESQIWSWTFKFRANLLFKVEEEIGFFN